MVTRERTESHVSDVRLWSCEDAAVLCTVQYSSLFTTTGTATAEYCGNFTSVVYSTIT